MTFLFEFKINLILNPPFMIVELIILKISMVTNNNFQIIIDFKISKTNYFVIF